MASIGSLQADLRLESAAFIRDLRKSAQETANNTSRMQKSVAGLQRGFASATAQLKGMVAGLAVLSSVRSLATLGKAAIDTADNVAKQSRALGVTNEELQSLRYAADLAGVEMSQLDTALGMFVKNLGGVRNAQGAFYASLKKTNPELLAQLRAADSTGEAFNIFLRAVDGTSNAAERARLAASGLGKQWQAAAKLIATGADEFERNQERAKAFGLVLSEDVLRKAEELQDQMTDIAAAVQIGFARGYIDEFYGSLNTSQEGMLALGQSAETFGRITASVFSSSVSAAKEFGRELENLSVAIEAASLTKGQGMEGLRILWQAVNVSDRNVDQLKAYIQKYALVTADLSSALDRNTTTVAKTTPGVVATPPDSAPMPEPPSSADVAAAKRLQEFQVEIVRTAEQTRTLTEATYQGNAAYSEMRDRVDATNEVLRLGVDANSQLGQSLIAMSMDAKQAARELEEAESLMRLLPDLANQAGSALASSFADAIVEGEDLIDTLNELLRSLAKMALNAAFMQIIGTAGTGGAAGTGLMGSLFHEGGIVGSTPAKTRLVPASTFVGAPKLHKGLKPDEFPAILQKGEGVFTPAQMNALFKGMGKPVSPVAARSSASFSPTPVSRLPDRPSSSFAPGEVQERASSSFAPAEVHERMTSSFAPAKIHERMTSSFAPADVSRFSSSAFAPAKVHDRTLSSFSPAEVSRFSSPTPYPEILRGGPGVSPDEVSKPEFKVNVVNNSGANVRTEEKDGPDGPELEVIIDNMVAANASRPGSATNRALRSMGAKLPGVRG